jgi:hypothetical protein
MILQVLDSSFPVLLKSSCDQLTNVPEKIHFLCILAR